MKPTDKQIDAIRAALKAFDVSLSNFSTVADIGYNRLRFILQGYMVAKPADLEKIEAGIRKMKKEKKKSCVATID